MHRQPQNQRVYTSTFCAWRSHACYSCPLSISQDTRVLFTTRRWNSGGADKLTEHVSFKRMAIAMPENSAVLLPYPVPRTGCCGWGLRWSKDNRPRPSNARRELDCGNGHRRRSKRHTSKRSGAGSDTRPTVVSTHAQARECPGKITGHESRQEHGAKWPEARLRFPAHPKSISPDRARRFAATPSQAGLTCHSAGRF
jgi:hypothetical protein